MPEQRLEMAQAAYELASQRRDELDAAAADAAVKLQIALDHRGTLIKRIAEGENLSASDHKKAEATVRDAESISAVAAAAADFGRVRFEEAQKELLHAQVDDIEARYSAVVDQHLEAARELDRRVAYAREAAEAMVAVDEQRRAIVSEAQTHGRLLEQLMHSSAGLMQNRVLAGLHRSLLPVSRKAAS